VIYAKFKETPSANRELADGAAARGSQSVADLSVKFTLHAAIDANQPTFLGVRKQNAPGVVSGGVL
jgi:hypothetical protein